MAPVLDGPVVPDGVREGCRGQHNGRGVKGGFLASRPSSGRGGADQGAAADAHEGRDERPPFGVAQRAGWVEDLDVTVLLPVAGAVAAGGGFEGPCRCGGGGGGGLAGGVVFPGPLGRVLGGGRCVFAWFFCSAGG